MHVIAPNEIVLYRRERNSVETIVIGFRGAIENTNELNAVEKENTKFKLKQIFFHGVVT